MDLNRDILSSIFIMPEIVGSGEGAMTEHMGKIKQSELAKKSDFLCRKSGAYH